MATVAALLLIVSTFGPFSFVEAAIVLTAAGVLALVKQRADRKRFHLPFGDGTVIFAAGLWTALLIVVRLFDRELGQSVLALACAAILAGAGARERAKRPADDLPPDRRGEDPTELLATRDAPTEERPRARRPPEARAGGDAPPLAPRARRPPPPEDDRDAPPPPGAHP